MVIFPAIDMIEGRAVRLVKGDYSQKTVYSEDPFSVALGFRSAGAAYAHIVDLEGARDGGTPNFPAIARILQESGLSVEVGGGIRDAATVEKYLSAGAARVILGTAALQKPDFLADMTRRYAEKIAVGVDLRDGCVAVNGWTEKSEVTGEAFLARLADIGVRTVIVTDISKDGAMRGTNRALYGELTSKFAMDIVASGGVSTIDDVLALKAMGLYGAIIGKALYTGAIDLREAVKQAV